MHIVCVYVCDCSQVAECSSTPLVAMHKTKSISIHTSIRVCYMSTSISRLLYPFLRVSIDAMAYKVLIRLLIFRNNTHYSLMEHRFSSKYNNIAELTINMMAIQIVIQ